MTYSRQYKLGAVQAVADFAQTDTLQARHKMELAVLKRLEKTRAEANDEELRQQQLAETHALKQRQAAEKAEEKQQEQLQKQVEQQAKDLDKERESRAKEQQKGQADQDSHASAIDAAFRDTA